MVSPKLLRFVPLLHIFAEVYSTILRLPCIGHADFTVFHKDKILRGHVIETLDNLDDVECMIKCVGHYECRSYNINMGTKKCELNGKALGDRGTMLSDEPGWLYKSTDYNKTTIGPTCEDLNPCPPGVLCKDKCESPFYECVNCDSNHTGLHCISIDECQSNPCQNGQCKAKFESYKCICSAGFTGKNCEIDIDECESLPCYHEATCHNLRNQYRCNCSAGFSGNDCDRVISCKDLNQKQPSRKSGFVYINNTLSSDGYTRVWCDMETDGGGWTQVLYIKSETSSLSEFTAKGLNHIPSIAAFRASYRYAMTTEALIGLRSIINFQQFRFRCSTDGGTKVFHVKTKLGTNGSHVVDYFSTNTTIRAQSCFSFNRMSDDNSFMAGKCESWGYQNALWGIDQSTHSNANLKMVDHAAFIAKKSHLNLRVAEQRYECDTYRTTSIIGNGDTWEYYVR